MLQAPISAPARPTRVNRKAVLVRGVASRRSEAMARMAPAPAQMPSMAATMGCGQWRNVSANRVLRPLNDNQRPAWALTRSEWRRCYPCCNPQRIRSRNGDQAYREADSGEDREENGRAHV